MAQFTIELGKIFKSGHDIFPFEYNFYEKEFIKTFEKKFIDHFYFHEIGFETVEKFKFRLSVLLNEISPKYEELYKTILESQNINFLLNKDLKETFLRDIKGDSISKIESESNDKIQTLFKESNLDNGLASVALDFGSLTNISDNNNNSLSNSKVGNNNLNNLQEKTELISKGNIGTTSSGQLVQSWRDIIINIDLLIFEECEKLFMGLY